MTVEAVWDFALPNGGGLNIAEAQLDFGPAAAAVFGDVVTSFAGLGDNFVGVRVGFWLRQLVDTRSLKGELSLTSNVHSRAPWLQSQSGTVLTLMRISTTRKEDV